MDDRFEFEAGRLLFLPVEGPRKQLQKLALFTLIRVVRPMPRLRSARPIFRSTKLPVSFELPSAEPLSREPKVAVLDGGLPDQHILGSFVRRYFLSDEEADDVQEYTEHGLAVTSALLFGPIEPGQRAERPYAAVDHHRVLDAQSDSEDPYELYRTLGHVEAVLLSQNYQFINLSLGPDLCVEDSDVHAWTAVIDHIRERRLDPHERGSRQQRRRRRSAGAEPNPVPADSVNALCVGAVDHAGAGWSRAPYSACGPGRSPGRRKPDVVAFGGSPKEYFHVVAPGKRRSLATQLGTSFAAPLALRAAVGIRAIPGADVHPLTIKALLVHGAEDSLAEGAEEVGWGRVPSDLNSIITCGDGVARIIYQGELTPGKYLRAPVPLPHGGLQGNVDITATFCYATPVDPRDASAYTKAGLDVTFRPDIKKFKPNAKQPNSYSFFPSNEWRTEAEMRNDLGKWETLLHAEHTLGGAA
ncbi:S8 family peptidase [Ramlibacter terrae]|uniref:S8 family peptidase n=1 Tax=Ramlibacter terrae TaxID=2732511 RepID=A0ABX6P6Q6_9BURK|nr:S8 family peptidase [Ramlibacter terrae]